MSQAECTGFESGQMGECLMIQGFNKLCEAAMEGRDVKFERENRKLYTPSIVG